MSAEHAFVQVAQHTMTCHVGSKLRQRMHPNQQLLVGERNKMSYSVLPPTNNILASAAEDGSLPPKLETISVPHLLIHVIVD